jgi:hypothetical protein
MYPKYVNGVTVLLNTGDGIFGRGINYATGATSWPSSVTAADFNGDGKLDLAVGNGYENTVSVLLNGGNGTFAGGNAQYATGSAPGPVVAADFNGDGNADLAVANWSSNTVTVLLNNGNGIFVANADYATGSGPVSLAVADFNGDGKSDLAVTNQNSNSVSELLNIAAPTVLSATFDYSVLPQRIRLKFNWNVSASLSISSLVVKTTPGNVPVSVTGYSYDASTNTATFTLPTPLPDGTYRATLAASAVTDLSGKSMAEDFNYDFFFLGGDANHDGIVDVRDLMPLVTNWGGSGKVFSQGDFNYDGTVDVADLTILSANWQKNVFTPAPVVVRPPKRTAFKVVSLIQ